MRHSKISHNHSHVFESESVIYNNIMDDTLVRHVQVRMCLFVLEVLLPVMLVKYEVYDGLRCQTAHFQTTTG